MDNKKVVDIFPSNDFRIVCENAAKDIECGIIIGYDKDGLMSIYGGGLLDGKQPVSKDWLWMVQTFVQNLLKGDYAE